MKMADKLVALFQDMGLRVVEHDVGPINSRILEAYWGEDRPGTPIMFGGHYDTVNCSYVENAKPGDENEFDGTPHFRVDSQGNAHGLGCLDMKGGIVVAIWAVKGPAIHRLGGAPHQVPAGRRRGQGPFRCPNPLQCSPNWRRAPCAASIWRPDGSITTSASDARAAARRNDRYRRSRPRWQ